MRNRHRLSTALAITLTGALFIFGCSNDSSETPQSTTPQPPTILSQETPQLSKTKLMTGLRLPWDLAFAPDGTMLYTEKCFGIFARRSNGEVVHLFGVGTDARLPAPDLVCNDQSGALGLALDPDFANNRQVFLYMTSNLSSPSTNRVVRLTLNADFTPVSRTDIVTDIAFRNQDNFWGRAGTHCGGRVRFGPDGFLYITTGDDHTGTVPQDLRNLGGKVLRVDRNGLAFTVFDLKAFVEKVKLKGVELAYEPKDVGFMKLTAFNDPDGNYIEFSQLSDKWFKHLEARRQKGIDVIARWQASKI